MSNYYFKNNVTGNTDSIASIGGWWSGGTTPGFGNMGNVSDGIGAPATGYYNYDGPFTGYSSNGTAVRYNNSFVYYNSGG